MKSRAEVMDKVRKLLALAGSDNPHEAASAAAHAAALMERHAIAAAEIDTGEPEEGVEKEQIGSEHGKSVTWRGLLARDLAAAHGCYVVWTRTPSGRMRLLMAGRPSDIRAAGTLYYHCAAEIDRLTARHARGRGRGYANSFRLGVVRGIRDAIAAERARLREELRGTVTSTALMVVDRRVAEAREAFGRLRQSSRARFQANGGYHEGQSHGAGVVGRSRQRVGGGSTPRLRG